MRYTRRRAGARLGTGMVAVAVGLSTACGDPIGAGGSSSFAADIRGARNERITGSATANSGGWERESAVEVTFSGVGTFSGIVLSDANQMNTISIMRAGTKLPDGTHRVYGMPVPTGVPTPVFTGGYVVRRTDGLQVFLADSGTVSLATSGNRVSGTFTLYANRYKVIEHPTPGMTGQTVTPIASGNTPTTITGSFNAVRR